MPSLTLEVIMDYLEGKLSSEESAHVEAVLQEEPEWIDAIEHLELLLEQNPDTREKALLFREVVAQEAFRQPEQAVQKKPVVRSLPFWQQPVWRMAAVITLLFLPIGYFFVMNQGSLYDQMSSRYLEPFAATTVKGVDPTAAEILAEGLATYQNGNYPLAAKMLNEIVSSTDLTEDEVLTARMYLGLSYLFAKDAPLAVTQLQQVLAAGNTIYYPHAQWYLAWAHWQAEDTSAALARFEEVAKVPGTHQQEAKAILKAWH